MKKKTLHRSWKKSKGKSLWETICPYQLDSSLDRNKRLLSISWSDGLISEWPPLQGILMLELKVSTMGLGVRHVFWGVTWKDSTALICRGLSFTCVNACSPCHKMTGSFDESSPIFLNHKNLFPLFEWSDL